MHEIKSDVYWTGYIDWDLRVFHGYSTPNGSTYNSYLIVDEKPTLIDAVKDYGFDEMLGRIKKVIDPSKIEYIISNHTEMDHSGSIGKLLEYCPNAEIVCSPKGHEHLKKHFKKDWKFKVVQTGEELDIGKRKLKFLLMPMVHWPDSMATYCEYDKILFSNDAFGQHYASEERYADEIGLDTIIYEAGKYYANIVLPYGQQVLKVLEAASELEIESICSSHGLIWRRKEDIELISNLYSKWANYEADNSVVIVYDTMWQSTEAMANRLQETISKEGISVKMFNLQQAHISDVVAEVLCSKFFLFGTPILNNRMLPTMAGMLMYFKGLKPKNRFGLSFGSYGWATVGFKEFEMSIKDAGFDLMGEGRYINFVPDSNDLDRLNDVVSIIKENITEK